MLTGILALVEYSDPTAQNIELSVSDRIPVKFKVAFALHIPGSTKPATKAATYL